MGKRVVRHRLIRAAAPVQQRAQPAPDHDCTIAVVIVERDPAGHTRYCARCAAPLPKEA
jgi:hypothetical protein